MVSGMRCGHFIKSLHLIQKCSLLVTALLKAEPEMKHWCLAGHWWGCSRKLERGRKEYQMGKRRTTGGIWLQSLLWAKGLYSAAATPVLLLEDKMLCAMHACSQRSQLLDSPGLGCPFSWPSSVPRTWDRMQSSETHTLKVRCCQCTGSETHATWGWEQRASRGTWHGAQASATAAASSESSLRATPVLKQGIRVVSFSNTAPAVKWVWRACILQKKVEKIRVLVLRCEVMSDSSRAHRWQPTRLPRPGILQAVTLEWVAISFSLVIIVGIELNITVISMHFPSDKWCWTSFHVFPCNLYISSSAISVQAFCPFTFIGLFTFLILNFKRSFNIMYTQVFKITWVSWKYFLRIYG